MTYEVKGEPTAYFLAECFKTMIQGLVSTVNQREHQHREFWLWCQVPTGPSKIGHNCYGSICSFQSRL